MELTHLGHACLLVDTGGTRVLLDPGTLSDFDDVRDLAAVLVTHQHPDHLDVDRLRPLLAANPGAALWVDPDTASSIAGLPDHRIAHPGERFTVGDLPVDVLGGIHARVYADVPGCTNSAYSVGDGALFHPGDSFARPDRPIDVLAVAVDGPWLKIAEAIDYVHAVAPRRAVPIHEGETTDPAKYTGMLAAFAPAGVVRVLPTGRAVTV